MALPTYSKQYINGEWVESTNAGNFIDVFDSNTGAVCAHVIDGSTADTEAAIQAASAAFKGWSATPLAERKACLERLLEEYEKLKPSVAEALQKELGAPKLFSEMVQSNMFTLHVRTLLKLADDFEWKTILGSTTVVKEPIGVVGAITPWNWPLNQIACKLAPALLAGCTFILKPSEVTPINAFLVAEAVHAAGFPKGVFNLVCGNGPNCGELLATHPLVDMVSFTGSTPVGRKLHALGASTIKRVRTELGGKSAAIILDDASPEQIRTMATHVIGNTGQTCSALSRLIVPTSRYEESVEIAKDAFEAVKVVSASDPGGKLGDVGPLASQQQFNKVTAYIRKGIEEGARLVTGGPDRPEGVPATGYFVKPTVFADVHNKMTIAQEEIFGPVLSIIPYHTEDQAIDIANDTIFGLNSGVAGTNVDHAMQVASQLRAGQVHVNTTSTNPLAPFGGYKQSGDGREWGAYGLEEFLQIKAINTKKPKKQASKL